jgi:hypothetical protein
MKLDFTKLSDIQIRSYLKFLDPEFIENGSIERFTKNGKNKIIITYYNRIIIEKDRIIYFPAKGESTVLLSMENLKNYATLFDILMEF